VVTVNNTTPDRESERILEYDNIVVAHEYGVTTVTLDSTAGRNAFRLEMANELVSVATTLGDDPETLTDRKRESKPRIATGRRN